MRKPMRATGPTLAGCALLAVWALGSARASAEADPAAEQWQALTRRYSREYRLRQYPLAADGARRAVEAAAQAFGPDDPRTAQTLNDLGHLHQLLGEHGPARRLHGRALEIRERHLDAEDASVVQSLVNLGKAHHELSDYRLAQPLFLRALRVLEKQSRAQQPRVAEALAYLARGHSGLGEERLAEPLFRRAVVAALRAPRVAYVDVDRMIDDYAACLDRLGKSGQAQAVRQRRDPLFTRHEGG